jgi:hypothetical protein
MIFEAKMCASSLKNKQDRDMEVFLEIFLIWKMKPKPRRKRYGHAIHKNKVYDEYGNAD